MLVVVCSGCLPASGGETLTREVKELKRRLANTELDVVALRKTPESREQEIFARLDSLGHELADQQNALATLRVELQSLSGRLEDTGHDRQLLRDDIDLLKDDLGLRLTGLENRQSSFADALQKVSQKLDQPPPKAPETEPLPAPEKVYDLGLDLIQHKGEFLEGRKILTTFLAQFPDHPLAVNARYWIGESYYGEKNYDQALLTLQELVQTFPDHPKAAAALLKQAVVLQALDHKNESRFLLEQVIERFPLSEEAAKAKARLTDL